MTRRWEAFVAEGLWEPTPYLTSLMERVNPPIRTVTEAEQVSSAYRVEWRERERMRGPPECPSVNIWVLERNKRSRADRTLMNPTLLVGVHYHCMYATKDFVDFASELGFKEIDNLERFDLEKVAKAALLPFAEPQRFATSRMGALGYRTTRFPTDYIPRQSSNR